LFRRTETSLVLAGIRNPDDPARSLISVPTTVSRIDLGVDSMTLLKWIFTTSCQGDDYFNLAQGRDEWRAVVNMVMNLRVPQNMGYFLTGEEQLVLQDRLTPLSLLHIRKPGARISAPRRNVSRFSTNFRGKFWDSILTVQHPVVIICTACCNVKNPCVLPTQCMYEVHRILTIKSHYFPKHLGFVIVPRCVLCELWSEFVYLIYINFIPQSVKINSKPSCETVPHGHS